MSTEHHGTETTPTDPTPPELVVEERRAYSARVDGRLTAGALAAVASQLPADARVWIDTDATGHTVRAELAP